MKSRAALALSIAGILVTGSAALAANTYTLNSSHTSTLGNAGNVLLPDVPVTTSPAPDRTPTNTVASPKATPKATSKASSKAGSGKKADGTKTSPSGKPSPAPAPGSNQGGPVTAQPAPGVGGLIVTPPGDDKGGLRGGGSGGHGSDD